MRNMKQRLLVATVGAAAAASSMWITTPAAHAGPLCSPSMAAIPSVYQQCLAAERNQNECGQASGCAPGDPCVSGSPSERAICGDRKIMGH
jgi:uncharacterized low-complexity protein